MFTIFYKKWLDFQKKYVIIEFVKEYGGFYHDRKETRTTVRIIRKRLYWLFGM